MIDALSFTPEQVAAALQTYATIISQWPELDNGMFLPEQIPEDLLMPFGALVQKHGIQALVPTFNRINTGIGDLLTAPTIENVRVVGLSPLRSLSTGFLTTLNDANRELYDTARAELLAADSLLLNSHVSLYSSF